MNKEKEIFLKNYEVTFELIESHVCLNKTKTKRLLNFGAK